MSLLRRIGALVSLTKLEQENEDELRSHLDMRTAENIAAGMTPEQAHRDALLPLGNPALMKERIVAEDAALTLESLFADVRYALRQLVRSHGFAVIAILTLALGIGATTGIFSILNAWIIQPLPLKDPQQLVIFWRAAAAIPTTHIGETLDSGDYSPGLSCIIPPSATTVVALM
jgi:hypothetical protein